VIAEPPQTRQELQRPVPLQVRQRQHLAPLPLVKVRLAKVNKVARRALVPVPPRSVAEGNKERTDADAVTACREVFERIS
jgi:hypothetical protein